MYFLLYTIECVAIIAYFVINFIQENIIACLILVHVV